MTDAEFAEKFAGYRELLIGCGRSRDKRIDPGGAPRAWQNLTTLDSNEDVKPDVVLDLEVDHLSDHFGEDVFNEVHAYEVLEHLGRQGDAIEFFITFADIWRVLKPGGFLCGTCPSRFSEWLWGDPGHTRAILPVCLKFLSQPFYDQCDGPRPTAASDYRAIWQGDFEIIRSHDDHTLHWFVLQAIKPPRGRKNGR